MRQLDLKKLLLPNLPYLLIGLYATKLGEAWRLAPGVDASAKLLGLMDGFAAAFQSALPSFHPVDLLVGLCCGAALRLAVYIKGKNAKKYRKNMEYGSARWGTAEDIKPFMDPVFENNIILTQTERLTMNSRPKDPRTARNKNVLIIGGSGSGKTRFWLKPNLMQCTSKTYPTSFVVTDPKGSILIECGKMLTKVRLPHPFPEHHQHEKIHALQPLRLHPLGEGHPEAGNNADCEHQRRRQGRDDFWVKAETLLFTALIGYIHYEAPTEEQNFSTLLEMINAMEVREDDEEFENPVDLMFKELESRQPGHFAVRQYKKYKLAAGKTAKSILISAAARTSIF